MKYHLLLGALIAALPLAAQSDDAKELSTYTYGINGERNAFTSTTVMGNHQEQTVRSINGREIPVEQVEETVLSEDANGRVVDRVIRRFDQNGQPVGEEKQHIEEQKLGGDHTVTNTTVYQKDLNGNFAVRERSVTDTQVNGEVERAETRIERPDINGSFSLQESQVKVTTGTDKDQHVDVTVLRPNTNGSLDEASRQVIDTKVNNNETTTTALTYNTAVSGQMEATGQKVTRVVKNPDGSEQQTVDIYGTVLPGRSINATRGGLQLREQQVIEKTVGSDQTVTETFSVRHVNLDTGGLGDLHKISETVCTGNCLPPPPAKPEPAAAPAKPEEPATTEQASN